MLEPSENKKKQKPPDWLIDNIAEASKNARKIYLLYVVFLAYCALTVVSTSDRQIVLNDMVRLPLINLDVSLVGFFIITPLVTIFLFVYLQLYLSRIHGLITDLRTSYAPIEKRRLYPWMLNIAEDPEPGFIGKLQRGIAKFSLWWSLPIVLIFFAFWFVKKHDPILSYIIGVLPIPATFIVLYFWSHYEDVRYEFTFKGGQVLGFVLNERGKVILASIVLIFEVVLLFFIIPWAMKGGKYEFLKPWICVDLSDQVLVTKPAQEYETIYWLNLKKVHLEGADLTSAILKRADLRNAYFQQAKMLWVNMEKANLFGANLQGAILLGANLQGANLSEANLQKASLFEANLQGACLSETDFQKASLFKADFQKANLFGANLQGSDLAYADLQGANLFGANLQGAELFKTNLKGANLRGTNLQGADVWNIYRIGHRVLETDELLDSVLSKAKTLYEAKMDSELKGRLKEDYPHLFERPKD